MDILLHNNSHLSFLNQFMRWVVIDGTREFGEQRYAMVDNLAAKEAAMGVIKRGKQNNFRIKYLMDNAIDWKTLIKEIEVFLDQS